MAEADVTAEIHLVFAKAQGLLSRALELHGNKRLVAPPRKRKAVPTLTDEGERIMQRLIQEISKLTFLIDTGKLTPELIRNARKKFAMDTAISKYPAGRWGDRDMVTCQKCGWPWFPKSDPRKNPPSQCPRCKNEPMRDYVRARNGEGERLHEQEE